MSTKRRESWETSGSWTDSLNLIKCRAIVERDEGKETATQSEKIEELRQEIEALKQQVLSP